MVVVGVDNHIIIHRNLHKSNQPTICVSWSTQGLDMFITFFMFLYIQHRFLCSKCPNGFYVTCEFFAKAL
jgi:hypothetical protein